MFSTFMNPRGRFSGRTLLWLFLFSVAYCPRFHSISLNGLYPGEDDRVLAGYEGGNITLGDLREELAGRKFYEQTPNDPAMDWKDFQSKVIREILARRVLDQEAREKGFAGNERYQARLEWERLKWVANQVVEQALESAPRVTQEQMEQYYQEHLDQFTNKTGFSFWHCFIPASQSPDDERRMAAYRKIAEIRSHLANGNTWEALQAGWVQDASVRIDLLGPYPRGQIMPRIEETVLSLSEGEISEVVETRHGYEILQRVQRDIPIVKPFNKCSYEIHTLLSRERRLNFVQEYYKRMTGLYPATLHPERISNSTPETILAQVGGHYLTTSDYQTYMNAFPEHWQAMVERPGGLEKLLRTWTENRILYDEAVRLGLDRSPQITNNEKVFEQKYLWQFYWDWLARNQVQVGASNSIFPPPQESVDTSRQTFEEAKDSLLDGICAKLHLAILRESLPERPSMKAIQSSDTDGSLMPRTESGAFLESLPPPNSPGMTE